MWSKKAVVNEARWASGGQAVAQAHAGGVQRRRAGGCAFGAGSQWCGVGNKQASPSPPISKAGGGGEVSVCVRGTRWQILRIQEKCSPGKGRMAPAASARHRRTAERMPCEVALGVRVGCDLNEPHFANPTVLRVIGTPEVDTAVRQGLKRRALRCGEGGGSDGMVTCVNKTTHLECGPGSGGAIIPGGEAGQSDRRRGTPSSPKNIAANIGYWLSGQIGVKALPCSSKQRGGSVGLPQGEGKEGFGHGPSGGWLDSWLYTTIPLANAMASDNWLVIRVVQNPVPNSAVAMSRANKLPVWGSEWLNIHVGTCRWVPNARLTTTKIEEKFGGRHRTPIAHRDMSQRGLRR
ncbi:hypothetical protein C8J57DRAFT_1229897 [Mycena rebaudengoi]|nr:hypothetical protein C8J57DRAFT_1229897 [Mycena rebaudengoi]